ncbi:O-antigen translocase [Flavobacterium algicola]|uniref:O-antigen translocase n=1 Tax=Flavobacterium algicola TaxID=556529 RepID=UPI001EFE4209|nr:O-antigen translocase [Flavobacterium algicola]MCG9793239.1 O-antigen translocase [Flavobacterium algicola]
MKKITNSELFKISSLNGISVLLKIGIGLISSKVLAVFVGPSGIALLGNLRNFMTSLESVSTLGFQNGIIKYVSEHKNSTSDLQKIISTSFFALLFIALLLSTALFCFASFWNQQIFGASFDFSFAIRALSLALPWYAASVFFNCIINGLGLFRKVIWITIIGNFISIAMTLVLVINYDTLGALLAIVLSPALVFFASYYFINAALSLSTLLRFQYFDFKIIKNLSSYSLMAMVPALLGPLVLLRIRTAIIREVGIDQAGYWETMSRLSTYYMMFIGTILSVFYFQKLAQAKNNEETKTIFWSYYKNIIPLFSLMLVIIYFLRVQIVQIVFTKDFLPVADLFFLQLTGDVLKASSLILGYQFLAKKLTIGYIISEIASLSVLYIGSIYLVGILGVDGVLLAQLIDNLIYLLILIVIFRKSLF